MGTPASDKRMPDGPASPTGVKRSSMPDGESENCSPAFIEKAIVPIDGKNSLKDAAGKN